MLKRKKNGAGQGGAQAWKQQPTQGRSKTGADAPALCHFQRAQERLETAKKPGHGQPAQFISAEKSAQKSAQNGHLNVAASAPFNRPWI